MKSPEFSEKGNLGLFLFLLCPLLGWIFIKAVTPIRFTANRDIWLNSITSETQDMLTRFCL